MHNISRTGSFGVSRERLHWWCVVTACLTFVLLFSGGLVTSHGAGMSVPDWPTTYGYNMFLFPFSRWVGGIFFEHSHRLIGSGIGTMAVVLTIWVKVADPRKWVRVLAVCAFVAVAIQGLLGGLRVDLAMPQIGIFHAMLGQSCFCLMTIIAIVTSRRFVEGRWADYEPDLGLRGMTLFTTILIFCQLAIAATMRHQHAGLSIPDFPLAYGHWLPDTSAETITRINDVRAAHGEVSTNAFQIWLQMAHRGMAGVIFLSISAVFYRANFVGPHARTIRLWSTLWLLGVLVQVCLGAWTIWSNKAADIATSHMALGALLLALGAVFTFRIFCGSHAGNFVLPDDAGKGLMARVA